MPNNLTLVISYDMPEGALELFLPPRTVLKALGHYTWTKGYNYQLLKDNKCMAFKEIKYTDGSDRFESQISLVC